MARISSATTVTLTAFITETGRDFLAGFDNNNKSKRIVDGVDMFKPTTFTLYDSDTNYKSSERIESGDMVALGGTADQKCIKSIANQTKKHILIYAANIPTISFEKDLYEITQGEAVSIPVQLSHLQGDEAKSADSVINEILTTLQMSNFSIDKCSWDIRF